MPELTNDDDDATGPNPGTEPKAMTLSDHLESDYFRDHLDALLPEHLKGERFASVAMRAISKTPKLAECTLRSVMGGIMEAASLGLSISSQGESWLVPFNNKVKPADGGKPYWELQAALQIGVWGHVKLCHQSKRISGIQLDVMMEGDEWSFAKGTNGHLHHVPRQGRDLNDVDRIQWVYAVIATDGWVPVRSASGADSGTQIQMPGIYFDAFDAAWIERIRKSAQSYDSPAWTNWFAEMAMAKCLKRVCKIVPKSTELARAVTMGDELDAGVGQTWQTRTELLLPDMTDQTKAAMASMGQGLGREPEPETVTTSAKKPTSRQAERGRDDSGGDEPGPADHPRHPSRGDEGEGGDDPLNWG